MVFITDSLCGAKPDLVGDRQTKDVPVMTEGSMESLAQTSDIDKAGSQIPCRAAQSNSCAHTQTNTHMHARKTWIDLQKLAPSECVFEVHDLKSQENKCVGLGCCEF